MPALPSIRIAIVENIKTTLETITIANGYLSNLAIPAGGGGVFFWAPPDPSNAAVPYAVVAPLRETPVQRNAMMERQALEVTIVLLATQEGASLSGYHILEKLLHDVQRALMVDPKRGQGANANTVEDTVFGDREWQPVSDTDSRLCATLTATVTYRTKYGNPALAWGA